MNGVTVRRLASATVVVSLVLQACSSSGATSAPSAAGSQPAASAPAGSAPAASVAAPSAAGGPVSFTMWTSETYTKVPGFEAETQNPGDWDKLIAQKYMDEHPNVKIDVQVVLNQDAQAKMIAAVQAAQPPDIYFDSGVRTAKWAEEPDLIEDMATLLPQATLDDVIPAYREATTVNGIMYSMPTWEYPLGYIRYNKALFDEKGITIPEDGVWSYADWAAAADKIVQPGKKWMTAVRLTDEQGDYDWWGYMWGFGCRPFTEDYSKSTMNTPECAKGLQWLVDANENGWLLPGTTTMGFDEIDIAYATGNIAVSYGRSNPQVWDKTAVDEGKATVPLDSQIVLFPHEEGLDPAGLTVYDAGYQVFKQDDPAKRAAIGEYLAYVAKPEWQKPATIGAGSLSGFKSVGNPQPDDANIGKILSWIDKYGTIAAGINLAQFAEIRLLRIPLMQAAILGERSVEDTLVEMDKQIDAVLNK
jgi:ABC-type glycerol-3-phosphate transport system substrate-binding protein